MMKHKFRFHRVLKSVSQLVIILIALNSAWSILAQKPGQPNPIFYIAAESLPLKAEWAAVRHQYDPGYEARVHRNKGMAMPSPVPAWLAARQQYDLSAAAFMAFAPKIPEWIAVRRQYDPDYEDRLSSRLQHDQSPVPDWLIIRQQYDPDYEDPLQPRPMNCAGS